MPCAAYLHYQYLSWFDNLQILSRTLANATQNILAFFVLFALIFMAFTMNAFLLFAEELETYHTFANAVYSLFRSLVGDTDIEIMEERKGMMALLLAVTFMFVMVFVLLTMLIAIINEAFVAARQMQKETAETRSNLNHWCSKLVPPNFPNEVHFRCVMFDGNDLAIGDEDTQTSDPYVKIVITGPQKSSQEIRSLSKPKAWRTGVQLRTLDPVFNERFEVAGSLTDDRIVISVYDQDITSDDEFLGQAIIPIDELDTTGIVHHLTLRLKEMDRCPDTGRLLEASQSPLPTPINEQRPGSRRRNASRESKSTDSNASQGDAKRNRWANAANQAVMRDKLGDFAVKPKGTLNLSLACRGYSGEVDTGDDDDDGDDDDRLLSRAKSYIKLQF